ncbi:MAG TPA: hypothetical protein PLT38_04450, partial [Rubrivivax sp.]|nr:hypothetical protein [Rubrivivax sp.]
MADLLLFIDRIGADADRAPAVLEAAPEPGALQGMGRRDGFAGARLAPPADSLSAADYAIGLHAASLVADGGTLQLGADALGDALARALSVRERHGEEYAHLVQCLSPEDLTGRELGRFRQGLYGCAEVLSP